MSAMTTATTSLEGRKPDYYEGRAEAYDDTATLTLDELTVRAGAYADYANIDRAFGYMDRVIEFRMESDAVAAAETELAHTPVGAR